MDAPPPRENCAPFVRIARLLADAGVHAPTVLAQDLERGFLLLTDLGTTTYLQALDDANANALFGDALDTLVRWQLATREAALPPYDDALLRRELELFPEWYVGRHLGRVLSDAERQSLSLVFDRIFHRDGKSGYVEDTPRFIAYVRPVIQRYRDLAPLAKLIDQLEQRIPSVGYTF